jgi:hypothetical protein
VNANRHAEAGNGQSFFLIVGRTFISVLPVGKTGWGNRPLLFLLQYHSVYSESAFS